MLHIEGPIKTSGELRTHVIQQIESGAGAPGERLPSVRRLAEELGLAANTVAKAYRELEAAGWVHTAGRRGTVVAARMKGNGEARALELARDYVREMHGLGLDVEDAVRFVRRAAD